MTVANPTRISLSVASFSAPIPLRHPSIPRSLALQHSFSFPTVFVFNTFWPLLQKRGGVYPEPFELDRSRANCFPGV